jgi:hypothetical protein
MKGLKGEYASCHFYPEAELVFEAASMEVTLKISGQ